MRIRCCAPSSHTGSGTSADLRLCRHPQAGPGRLEFYKALKAKAEATLGLQRLFQNLAALSGKGAASTSDGRARMDRLSGFLAAIYGGLLPENLQQPLRVCLCMSVYVCKCVRF